jgi:hypothetical protein
LKIILDGIDVTHDTYDVDKEKGTISKYKRNEKGHYYIENGKQAFEILTGKIELVGADGNIQTIKKVKNKKEE